MTIGDVVLDGRSPDSIWFGVIVNVAAGWVTISFEQSPYNISWMYKIDQLPDYNIITDPNAIQLRIGQWRAKQHGHEKI